MDAREARRRKVLARARLGEEQLSSALINGSVSELVSEAERVSAVEPPVSAQPVPREPLATRSKPQFDASKTKRLRQCRALLFVALGTLCAVRPTLAAKTNLLGCFALIETALTLCTRGRPSIALPANGLEWLLLTVRALGLAVELFGDFCCFCVAFIVVRRLWAALVEC